PDGEAAEPRVVRHQEVLAVAGDVGRAVALEDVVVDAVAVEVAHEHAAAVAGRPVVAEVDHAAGVGVAAAGFGVGVIVVFGRSGLPGRTFCGRGPARQAGPTRGSARRPVAAAPVDVVADARHQL